MPEVSKDSSEFGREESLSSLLRTKLYIPPLRSTLVTRQRLIEMLNKGMDCKLILILAPAGFGKTTLLSEWIHQDQIAAT